ncbi:MAG: hypothetical protein U1E29_18410 [Coriobacteriia bacterium]|nr:hypothetical protein [Coriobacteriia bacterium]
MMQRAYRVRLRIRTPIVYPRVPDIATVDVDADTPGEAEVKARRIAGSHRMAVTACLGVRARGVVNAIRGAR